MIDVEKLCWWQKRLSKSNGTKRHDVFESTNNVQCQYEETIHAAWRSVVDQFTCSLISF